MSLPQPPIVATDTAHLTQLIAQAMREHGNDCDLNHIDVSNITYMSRLFYRLPFNGDISKWDVSNVTDMDLMFSQSAFRGDISQWDVSNVNSMRGTFWMGMFNGDIANWNVSKVENMSSMFSQSLFAGDISNWDVRSLKTATSMFCESPFKGDLSRWTWHNDVNIDKLLDTSTLAKMSTPCLYHWQMLSAGQGLETFATDHVRFFQEYKPMFETLCDDAKEMAMVLNNTWATLHNPKLDQALALPELTEHGMQ